MTEKKKESSLSLSAKAKKFGVSLSTLKKVYKRGVAAWNSGHRPGTTPQQWGHARVNSFLRKGKTYHTADKDLREGLDVNQLFEMQLVGTDEYRQHAIAMTPGQDQEIENAFPFDEYGDRVDQTEENTETDDNQSDGTVESGDSKPTGMSFRAVRKKLQEQEVEEIEGEEDEDEEEEELEDDGYEDGVDFTPNLKTTKPKKTGTVQYASPDISGMPVLTASSTVYEQFRGRTTRVGGVDYAGTLNANQKAELLKRQAAEKAAKVQFEKDKLEAERRTLKQYGKTTPEEIAHERKVAQRVARMQAKPITAAPKVATVAKSVLGKVALPATVAVGAYDAYKGFTADPKASTQQKLQNAAKSAASGLTMGLVGTDAETIKKTAAKKKTTLSEAIEYHQENNISLVENVYRPGSEMFFAMILEAKRLYAEGNYTPKDEYEQDLLESDIGEVAEYEGKSVLLDFPIEEEMDECWKGYMQKGMKKKGDKMVPNCVPMNEEDDPTKGRGIGKPFRSGGGGAVYVRSGKGNIVKVNFSQSGMKKRYNEPARVKSFMARHHCLTNKDRTSASYWACRWPRYFSNTGQRWW